MRTGPEVAIGLTRGPSCSAGILMRCRLSRDKEDGGGEGGAK